MSYEAKLTAPLEEGAGSAWLSARPARVRYPTRIRIEEECLDIVGGSTGDTGPGEVSVARGVMSSEAAAHPAGVEVTRWLPTTSAGAGSQGPQGVPGPAGAAGADGPQGPEGPQGPAGPAGPQGVKGDKGDKGDTGNTGPAGPTGPAGADGAQGATGADGEPGPKGDPGDDGPQGPPGNDGVAGQAFPVGSIFIAAVSTSPASLLGYGTWAAFAAGRVLIGRDAGDADFDTAEETGGAKTKALSAHAGAAVADHAALAHSAHAGTAVGTSGAGGSHVHAGPSHTHGYSQVPNHVHNQMRLPTATGAVTGFTVDTSMSGTPATSGVDTGNPAGGVASGTTVAGGTADTGAEAAHTHAAGTVTQPSAHSDHAAQVHSVGQASAHADLNVVQPYIVVYMWKRTA